MIHIGKNELEPKNITPEQLGSIHKQRIAREEVDITFLDRPLPGSYQTPSWEAIKKMVESGELGSQQVVPQSEQIQRRSARPKKRRQP